MDAYAAGLVDGEGCIYVVSTNGGKQFAVRVDVGMTAKAAVLLETLRGRYGGSVSVTRRASERWEEARCWALQGTAAAEFLRRIQPHLILKEEQARLALRVHEIRDSLPRTYGGRSAWTEDARRRCATIKRRIHELNRKGPALPEPTAGYFARLVAGEWVTDQYDLFSDLGFQTFSGTWPRAGMTRSGTAYRRQPSVPLTDATGSSSWPTPVASDAGKDRGSSAGWGLRNAVRQWPTPTASDGFQGGTTQGNRKSPNLSIAVYCWATPTSSDATGGPGRAVSSTGGTNLRTQAGGALNPTWVEALMGFPLGWTDLTT